MIEFSKEDLEDIKARVVRALIQDEGNRIRLYSPAQACGLMDISPATLASLKIPRVVVKGSKVIKYRLRDIEKWIEENTEVPA